MSSKDINKECVMYVKSDKIEIMINDKADEFIEEGFSSLLSRYQTGLEASIKTSDPSLTVVIYCITDIIK